MTSFYVLSNRVDGPVGATDVTLIRYTESADAENAVTECIRQGRAWKFFVVYENPADTPPSNDDENQAELFG